MNYHNITTDDMLNGDGLRTVLWVAGCGHGCPGCHNPVTWDACGGLPFDAAAKAELFEKLAKPHISGITFSGGDPLYPANRDAITALAAEVRARFPKKTVWLYTGYTYEEIADLPVFAFVDVLVDGRYEAAKRDVKLHWKGSANQRVIDIPATRAAGSIVLHDTDYGKDKTR